MRVLLSTYGSRGDVEPMAGLAVALQALGVETVVSAPPDQEFIDLLKRAGVAFVPAFMGVRDWIATAGKPPVDLPRRAAEMARGQFPAIDAAAEGCDLIVATGLMPSAAAARAVAERRGVAYAHATFCPLFLPSEHHAPFPYPGHPHPPGVTDPRALWDHNIEAMNALFGAAVNDLRARQCARPRLHRPPPAGLGPDPVALGSDRAVRRGADGRLDPAGPSPPVSGTGGLPRGGSAAGLCRLRQHGHGGVA
ncbi:hypothetical protein [Brevundimonas sp. Root1279]|uniref:hypothetical protein n=1 Tax=Brevundimonas sp. Root1279 TaxID=1736443 RepID=UPI001F19BEA5|nr:hypothetical protein [Brevundimonas sp. Root1279]